MKKMLFTKKRNNRKRYREILSILSQYGFSFISEKVGEGIPFSTIKSKLVDDLSRGERIKRAIEELGPTFIKLGQILSTRYDMIPDDISSELTSLQDDVFEVDIKDIRQIFREETGQEIEEVYKEFNDIPLAAASIGQVHKAVLKTGEKVVVKIQRPGIRSTIEQDIDILEDMAEMVDNNFNQEGNVKAKDIIREFSESIMKELDYIHEAHSAQKMKTNSMKNKNVLMPKIYWEVTSKRVITMEEIKGIKVNDIESIEENGWDEEKISGLVAQTFLEQVFLDGLFHGDPHPGNILIVDSDVVSFIDFGIVGYIDSRMSNFITTTLRAIGNKNVDKIMEGLSDIEAITNDVDELGLRNDIFNIINYYFDLPMDKIDFAEGLNEFLSTLHKHRLKVPSQLTLLMKSMVTLEGTLKDLNPHFNLMKLSTGVLDKLRKKKLHDMSFKETFNSALNLYDTFSKIPGQMLSILTKLEKNQVKITMQQEGLETLEKEINTLTNKLSLSLLVSSLIVGSSIVIHADIRPRIYGVSLFGIVGYMFGLVVGLGFIISAIKSRKKY